MTLDEAKRVAKIIGTADGACSTCVGKLMEQLASAFPEFQWTQGETITEHFNDDGSPATADDADHSQSRIVIDVVPKEYRIPNSVHVQHTFKADEPIGPNDLAKYVAISEHEIAARKQGWILTSDGAFERSASDEPERVHLCGDWKELCEFADIKLVQPFDPNAVTITAREILSKTVKSLTPEQVGAIFGDDVPGGPFETTTVHDPKSGLNFEIPNYPLKRKE